MKALKAFRVDSHGRLRFLFHTHKGTSLVPIGVWIEAKASWVTDGSRQRKYRSGFHFFPAHADLSRFNALTHDKYLILPVRVEDVRAKPRSSVGSWIARRLMVPDPSLPTKASANEKEQNDEENGHRFLRSYDPAKRALCP